MAFFRYSKCAINIFALFVCCKKKLAHGRYQEPAGWGVVTKKGNPMNTILTSARAWHLIGFFAWQTLWQNAGRKPYAKNADQNTHNGADNRENVCTRLELFYHLCYLRVNRLQAGQLFWCDSLASKKTSKEVTTCHQGQSAGKEKDF